MSRKDYIAIAAEFARCNPNRAFSDLDTPWRVWNCLETAIADILARDNPQFDRQRFYAACEKM